LWSASPSSYLTLGGKEMRGVNGVLGRSCELHDSIKLAIVANQADLHHAIGQPLPFNHLASLLVAAT
jgi:hypothetical protein